MKISIRSRGLIEILLSGVCFALLGTFAKMAHARQLDVLSLLGVRFLFAGVLLLGFCLVFKKARLRVDQFFKAFLMGMLGYASFSFFYFKSLGGLSAGTAVVILFLYPLFVYFLELVQHRSLPTLKMLLVLFCCVSGVFLLVNGDLQVSDAKALWYGLTASLLYGIYVFLSAKYAVDLEPFLTTSVIQISAGICLCVLSQVSPPKLLEMFTGNVDLFVGLSFLSSILPMTLFLLAAQKLNSFELSVLNVTEPLFGILFSVLLLKEKLSLMQVIGAMVVLLVSIYVSRLKVYDHQTASHGS